MMCSVPNMFTMLCSQRIFGKNASRLHSLILQALFSRKSNNDNSQDVYKLVRSRDSVDDLRNSHLGCSPNWELLAPQGYRFYLPGSVGPAWHDETTTAHADFGIPLQQWREGNLNTLQYGVQECPILLREGLIEMFPGADIGPYHLTVVSLKQRLYRRGRRQDIDELAKFFVLASQDICSQLKAMGYWADFINPFSGRPYYAPHAGISLYKTDERFRCLGFRIESIASCKVISPTMDGSKVFVGSLFTSAPADTPILRDALDLHV